MLSFDWRWAEVGDAVVVHDASDPGEKLLTGVVAFVKRSFRSTEVGVRVTEDGVESVVWPYRSDVHPVPADPDETCLRCDGFHPVQIRELAK